MTNKTLIAVSICASLMAASSAWAQDTTVIHAGHLLDVPGTAPKSNQTIVIVDGKVVQIMPGFVPASEVAGAAKNVTFHDLSEYFVLPGLIDGHVHLLSEQNPQGRLQNVQMSEADRAMYGAKHASVTLQAGFTTVRDVGAGSSDAIFALRDGIAKGWIEGPRLFASGATISVTGGHGDGTQGYRDDIAHVMHSTGVCNGVAACRMAVREQVRKGADHIKLTATGGVLSNTSAGTEQQFFEDELKAIMETAHSMGRKVTAHAHGVNGINAALKAGVDSIEHGTYMDKQSVRLFKKRKAYLVPTLLAGATVVEWAEQPDTFLTPPQVEKALKVGPKMHDMAKLAHKSGVKIAFGTDSGVSRHGRNAREFALLVEAGLSPAEAIYSATIAGAANINQSSMLGSLEPGKFGDLIAVNGNPLEDVRVLENVSFVMKQGVVYKQAD